VVTTALRELVWPEVWHRLIAAKLVPVSQIREPTTLLETIRLMSLASREQSVMRTELVPPPRSIAEATPESIRAQTPAAVDIIFFIYYRQDLQTLAQARNNCGHVVLGSRRCSRVVGLGAVLVELGNGDVSQNADHRNHDHQFDQGKALLLFHIVALLV